MMNFFPAGKNDQILKFYRIVLSKLQITSTKNFNKTLILWHWKAIKSLGKSLIVVSKSAPRPHSLPL